jgi:hypothetical protein
VAIGAGQAGQAAELSSGPAIHQDLVRDYGFDGGYSTVRRYVECARPRRERRSEQRFEMAPGFQAQVGWSHEQLLRTTLRSRASYPLRGAPAPAPRPRSGSGPAATTLRL